MARNRIKVDIADLDLGMFVAQLDRPWLETPFLFQGFEVLSESDVDQLRHYCHYVYVDVTKGSLSAADAARISKPAPKTALSKLRPKQSAVKPAGFIRRLLESLAWLDPTGAIEARLSGVANYRNKVNIKKEAPRAASSYNHAMEVMNTVLDQVRDGCAVDVQTVRAAVTPMIDSVLRNPDAMSWLVTLQKQDDYSYHHSVASSVWAVVLGRHLGFDRTSLDKLGIGGLLLDIGKARIPSELLQKTGSLSDHEQQLMRQHVDFSMDMARKSRGLGRDVLDMIESHHERHDGSGYPRGLAAADIPVYGKIAGLVDCYDAMVTPRPYAAARSPYDAVRELNSLAGTKFQRELVEQFVQALGMFPTGSLIELNSGEVGIVTEQNRVRRLRPKVLLLLDANKEPCANPHTIDLRTLSSNASEPGARFIISGHEPGAFGIDPKDYFM